MASDVRERYGDARIAPFDSFDSIFNIYIGVMLRAHMFEVGSDWRIV